jgi:DNA-binding response OmpR family regulator
MAGRVVIIEDDPEILGMLSFNLEAEGYSPSTSQDGTQGLALVQKELPDLLLLDLMLPDLDGLDICRQLKSDPATREIPIIIVSAKGNENDIVLGLSLGADDYITKPFSVRELLARVKAVLRRRRAAGDGSKPGRIIRGGLVIDPEKHEVRVDDAPVQLRPAEFALLHWLASHPGRVFTREQLLSQVAGHDVTVMEHNVEVRIAEIRRKIGPYRDLIETVWAIGYRFRDEEE